MNVLYISDSPTGGGAYVAHRSVYDLIGGTWWQGPKPTTLQRATRDICGYCSPAMESRLVEVYRQASPDVIHLGNIHELGTAAIAAAVDLGIPVVWSCYDYWPLCPRCNGYGCCGLEPGACSWRTWQPAKGRVVPLVARLPLIGRSGRMRKWFNRLDGIVCLSHHSAALLSDHGFTAAKHVILLPITVPTFHVTTTTPSHVKRDPDLVLYVGGPHAAKGIHVWEAARAIVTERRPQTKCWTLVGANRDETLRVIARASVLVVPEQWQNPGPVVVWEANILGTRSVASRIGGVPESCPNATFEPRDAAACAEHVLRLLTERFEAPRFGPPGDIRWQLEGVYRCCSIRRVTKNAL